MLVQDSALPVTLLLATLAILEEVRDWLPTITVESSASPFKLCSSYFTCFGVHPFDLKNYHEVRESGLLRAVLLA